MKIKINDESIIIENASNTFELNKRDLMYISGEGGAIHAELENFGNFTLDIMDKYFSICGKHIDGLHAYRDATGKLREGKEIITPLNTIQEALAQALTNPVRKNS